MKTYPIKSMEIYAIKYMPSNIWERYQKGIKTMGTNAIKNMGTFSRFPKTGKCPIYSPPQKKNFFFNLLELLHSFLLYDH